MNPGEILNNIGPQASTTKIITFSAFSILKFPLILFLIGNIFFALLLYLRVRILSDAFSASKSKKLKSLIVLYMAIVVVGTFLAILFVLLS